MKRLQFFCYILIVVSLSGLLPGCSSSANRHFDEKMIEGDWIPADNPRYHKLPAMFYMSINLYNNKGGLSDSLFRVKGDSIFVRTYSNHEHLVAHHKDKWKFWHRILAVRNDSLFLYKRNPDSLAVFVNARVKEDRSFELKRIAYSPQPSDAAKSTDFIRLELNPDTLFVLNKGASGNILMYAKTDRKLFLYFQNMVRKLNWTILDNHVSNPDEQGPYLDLAILTDKWKKSYCCLQDFREPEFTLLIHELSSLPSLLSLQKLSGNHPFYLH